MRDRALVRTLPRYMVEYKFRQITPFLPQIYRLYCHIPTHTTHEPKDPSHNDSSPDGTLTRPPSRNCPTPVVIIRCPVLRPHPRADATAEQPHRSDNTSITRPPLAPTNYRPTPPNNWISTRHRVPYGPRHAHHMTTLRQRKTHRPTPPTTHHHFNFARIPGSLSQSTP